MLGSCPKVLVTNEGRECGASSVDHVSPRCSPHHPARPLSPGAAPRLQAAAGLGLGPVVTTCPFLEAGQWAGGCVEAVAAAFLSHVCPPCLSLAPGPWPCWGLRGLGAAGSFSFQLVR